MITSPFSHRRPDPGIEPGDGYAPDLPFSHGSTQSEDPGGALSLASSRPGDVLRVGEIFFGIVRERCRRLGLGEGDVVECRDVGDERIRVHHERGGSIALDLRVARFVLVRRVRTRRTVQPGGSGASLRSDAARRTDPLLGRDGRRSARRSRSSRRRLENGA